MTLSAFPGKIHETRQIVLNFLSIASPNIAPKPTGQSRSHSISRVPLQMSPARFFRFRSTHKIKGSSHKKKIKIFGIKKSGFDDFQQILWVYRTFQTQQFDTIGFYREIPRK